MALHVLYYKQTLPISIDEAWEFFSNPYNLKEITPPAMDFRVTSNPSSVMYAGMIITYTVKPMLRIPIEWVTEITHVKEKEFFVDEQRFGPYTFWHHQHLFKTVEGGMEMTDIVHYKLPYGLLGKVVHAVFVRKQLEGIFSYRKEFLEKKFPKK